MPQKKRVAILGGGMASLVTAFELVSKHPNRFDITVYQQGWRLGGKGASGRSQHSSLSAKDPSYNRIEEHGFHALMGFYDQTFDVLERCYTKIRANPNLRQLLPFDRVRPSAAQPNARAALTPRKEIHFNEDDGSVWTFSLDDEGPHAQSQPTTPVELARLLTRKLVGDAPPLIGFSHVVEYVKSLKLNGPLSLDLLKNFAAFKTLTPEQYPGLSLELDADDFAALAPELFREYAQAQWLNLSNKTANPEARRKVIKKELLSILITTFASGGVRGLYPNWDFSQIEGEDFREYLSRLGAHEETVNSALVDAAYNLTFSTHSRLSAGAALAGAQGFARCKDALYFLMNAGMGEIVFAPLFIYLQAAGVRFEFFHRLEELQIGEQRRVEKLRLTRQAKLRMESYWPLITVDGLQCWPSAPRYELLGEATEQMRHESEGQGGGEVVLEVGKDFDVVVFGMPVSELERVGKSLLAKSAKLRTSVESIKTTATRSAQLWFRKPLPEKKSGSREWNRKGSVLAVCPGAFDTWADMTHLIPREQWMPVKPEALVYLCGPIPESWNVKGTGPTLDIQVAKEAKDWLPEQIGRIWPGTQPEDVNSQYSRANVHCSDRYVLAVPGQMRLRTDESGFANLYLTGDWIRTLYNSGCIEAATLAGIQTAQKLSAVP